MSPAAVSKERSPEGLELLGLSEAGGETRLSVAPGEGGGIVSLRRMRGGRWVELLSRAPATGGGWRGGAPWLFPAVGRNFVSGRAAWRHAGIEYPMPIHGFAMDSRWTGEARAATIVCRASADAASRARYPFDFELEAEYALSGGAVRARLAVSASAANAGPMPFSLGNHLTLAISPAAVVRTPARREELLDERGLLSGGARPVDFRAGAPAKDEPRLRDCVLSDFPAGEFWAEVADPAFGRLRVSQREAAVPGAPARTDPAEFRFVFWGDAEGTFLCPEPWYGGPGSLAGARGTVALEPGGRFAWEMALEFGQ